MTTGDGVQLAVRVHPARGAPRARVLLVHAMMVDGRTFDRPPGEGFAAALAEEGLEAWRVDLRGHGASDRPRSWSYDDLVRQDLPAAVRRAGVPLPSGETLPVVLVGHSLGGHAGAAAVAEGLPVAALVMIAANVWRPSHEPSLRRRLAKSALLSAFLAATRVGGRFPARRLRIGTNDEARPYVEDLVGFWRRDAFRSRDGRDWAAELRSRRLPVLAVAGAGDRLLASVDGARRFADAFPAGCVDTRVLRAGRDDGWDADHMGLVTDPRSRPSWRWIARWIAEALPPRVSRDVDGAPRAGCDGGHGSPGRGAISASDALPEDVLDQVHAQRVERDPIG